MPLKHLLTCPNYKIENSYLNIKKFYLNLYECFKFYLAGPKK